MYILSASYSLSEKRVARLRVTSDDPLGITVVSIMYPTNIRNAKVCECVCLLLLHVKTTEPILTKIWYGADTLD
jgi:hypothetical protein